MAERPPQRCESFQRITEAVSGRETFGWSQAWARCLREAGRHTAQAADAEDATQEAMLRAWRAWDSCRQEGARLGWMLQIVRNEGRRVSQRVALGPMPADEVVALAAAPPPGDADVRVDVRRALDGLSAEERRLLTLRYVEDLTQDDVAAALGIPAGTAKVRLHRLRKRLQEMLAD